ncbi:MAG: M20/M25/M40 family metallo-hydrolase [Candidatus Omnitrophica bacterium]|nr:M20/M25/M40 family metallo-hydrolase [Candidatus Omnitrophota bacterium]
MHSIESHLKNIVGERTPYVSNEHLANVSHYLQKTLQEFGYPIELDPFTFQQEPFENIIARKKGLKSDARIIIGAHFDSVPGTPGADDNASGVAAMLELARMLAERKWNHTVEFIGFNLEEWDMVGSASYVNKLKNGKAKVRAMISLEMIGFTSAAPKSQKMPGGFDLFYPSVGNFIGLVGNVRSWKLLHTFKSKMKEEEGLPVESLIMPLNGIFLPAVRWSDHSPFWDAGYPALLITDTSFFRNPHYHGPTDTIETLDLDFIQKVTQALAKALIALDEG